MPVAIGRLWPKGYSRPATSAKLNGVVGLCLDKFGNIFIGEIQVCLIPATAIDKEGYRLGQGGGYYDQFLVGTSAFRIGIIHDREFVKKLPHEWFDQKVEAIATESGFKRL